jgi:hypothetical protein
LPQDVLLALLGASHIFGVKESWSELRFAGNVAWSCSAALDSTREASSDRCARSLRRAPLRARAREFPAPASRSSLGRLLSGLGSLRAAYSSPAPTITIMEESRAPKKDAQAVLVGARARLRFPRTTRWAIERLFGLRWVGKMLPDLHGSKHRFYTRSDPAGCGCG